MSFEADYKAKLKTAEEAVKVVIGLIMVSV